MTKNSYVSLFAGLGNQLFQYFFALAIEKRFGISVVLDDSRQERLIEHPDSRLSKTKLMLDSCKVLTSLGETEQMRRIIEFGYSKIRRPWLLKSTSNLYTSFLGTSYETLDTDPNMVLNPQHISNSVRYVGYFQSYEYFFSLDADKKEDFRSRCESLAVQYLGNQNKPELAVHVRRGDYRNRSDLKLLGPDYYIRAIHAIEAEGRRGILLSDEPNAKDVREISNLTGLDIVTGVKPATTVGLLASADSKVVANSSLSFASALMGGGSQNRKIAAPLNWANPGVSRPVRNYPPDWKVISN